MPSVADERAAASLVERAAADPHRPRFHVVSPAGWLNDPNGLTQWRGRYHLFYQYNPDAAVHHRIHWGHVSSTDLVHWRDEPVALTPEPGPDADGCWSGVLVDDGGTPTLVYSGHVDGVGQRACLAVGGPELRTWRKDPANPMIADPPPGLNLVEFRDHCVWRQDGLWHQLVGAGIAGRGGTALLYRSGDLRSWTYVGPILVGDAADRTVWTGSVWECVDLFPLGAHAADAQAGTDVLLLSVWHDQVTHYGVYYTGVFDGEHFEPRQRHHLDFGLGYFYAAQSFRDDRGRRVVFGWLPEGRPAAAQVEAGWSGVMSLPRELSLGADGELWQRPVAEVVSLRRDHRDLGPRVLAAGQTQWLKGVEGDQLDLEATVTLPPGAELVIGLRATADGVEQTRLVLSAQQGSTAALLLDRSQSSLDRATDDRELLGQVPLDPHGSVAVRILLDRSALEVFVGGRALTARLYPTRADAVGVFLAAPETEVLVDALQVWRMADLSWGPRVLRP